MPNRETRRLTMVIALFKFRLRPDIDMAEWEQTFVRMVGLASEMPGFVSVEPYAAEDGSGLAVVRFSPRRLTKPGRPSQITCSRKDEAAKPSSTRTT
jgi:hypothetical protein